MRLRAMCAPMMPRPMKPIFAMCLNLQCFGVMCLSRSMSRSMSRSGSGVGRAAGLPGHALHPAEAGGGGRARLVFATDVAFVAERIEQVEQERVVDFAGARFVAAGVIGELDVRDLR